MTSSEAPPLPADPVAYRRQGLSAWFWLVILLGLACIGLGVALAMYVPSWIKGGNGQPATIVSASRAAPTEAAAAPLVSGPTVEAAADPVAGDVTGLSARVRELEAAQAQTFAAASAALASASLIQAAQTSRPFAGELAAVQSLLPPSSDLTQLQRLAQTGAPTRSALAAEFPVAASHAIAAARTPDDKASLLERARHAISSIVTIRRVDAVEGVGPHAVLARAEAKLNEGDVEGALADLDTLPPTARDALGGWRTRAERRAEIDRRLSNVTEASLRALRQGAAL